MLNRRVEQFIVSRRHPQHPSGNAAKHKNYLFTIEALRCCHLLTKLRVNPFMKFLNIFSTVVAAFFFLALPVRSPAADARVTEDFDANWLFSKGDFAAAMMPAFNDGNWRTLNVPHDWSSEGPFSAEYGSGNGYAPGGIGWYC